jgi:hypothetical protein
MISESASKPGIVCNLFNLARKNASRKNRPQTAKAPPEGGAFKTKQE